MNTGEKLMAAFDAVEKAGDVPVSIKAWADSRAADVSLITNYLSAISNNTLDIASSISIIASSISNISVNANSMSSLVSISNSFLLMKDTIEKANRPSAIYKPDLFKDGDVWIARYGPSDRTGIAGMGDTPQLAMEAFDEAWIKGK